MWLEETYRVQNYPAKFPKKKWMMEKLYYLTTMIYTDFYVLILKLE